MSTVDLDELFVASHAPRVAGTPHRHASVLPVARLNIRGPAPNIQWPCTRVGVILIGTE